MIVYDFEGGTYIRRYVEPDEIRDDDTQVYYSKEAVKDIMRRFKERISRDTLSMEESSFIPEMPTDWSEDDEIDGL